MATIAFETNWIDGGATYPGKPNLRVPAGFTLDFLDGTPLPQLERADPATAYLAPEGAFRTSLAEAARFGAFAELLPPAEDGLYLAEDAPLVYHLFKRYGKQWWTMWHSLALPAGRYALSVELYPDLYTGDHLWAPDPLSGEWRLKAAGAPEAEWLNGAASLPLGEGARKYFGRWIGLTRSIEHPGGVLRTGLEFRARWGVEVVGVFLRRWRLWALGDAATPKTVVDSALGRIEADLALIRSAADALAESRA